MTLRLQPIYDIAEICALKGVREAVLCPGSRCAPITSSFVNHKNITARTFSDERSAGFIANGIALFTKKPVALVCTSGSAAFNFAPAVAEAFFQQIPIVVLTADRPNEWIDQLDGQTIRQKNIYGEHVKKYYELPQDYDHEDSIWHINRIINEAINLSNHFPKGPVHINIPLREPLYPESGETIQYSHNTRIIDEITLNNSLPETVMNELKDKFNSFKKILIVAGQGNQDRELSIELEKFCKQTKIPLVADIISNLHGVPDAITHADATLGAANKDVKMALQPELLITFGKSVISKNLKLYLRQIDSLKHWHIQPGGESADTFQSLTSVFHITPQVFFEQLGSMVANTGFEAQKRENYLRLWEAEEHRTQRTITSYFSTPQLNEFSVVHEIITNLPTHSSLHLANSMPVRYVNYIGLTLDKKDVEVFANRGTSGIDGCTSTAVGYALSTEQPTFLITGDMAFLYDRNAFWHNYKIPNLRIVVLNNHGGGIFSMINGPSQLSEADEYFVTNQKLNARSLAQEHGIDYLKLDNLRKLKNLLKDFFEFDGRTKMLEIESETTIAKKAVEEFKNQIEKNYDT